MKRLFAFVVLCLAVSVLSAKPRIYILATGGTIAGVSASATSSAYSAGQVGIESLLMLALTQTHDWQRIQQYFSQY